MNKKLPWVKLGSSLLLTKLANIWQTYFDVKILNTQNTKMCNRQFVLYTFEISANYV